MNKLKRSLVIGCIISSFTYLYSQEFLSPLNYNEALKEPQKQAIYKYKKPVMLNTNSDLPFFDDFSDSLNSPYPKQSLWTDKYVFINTTYCSNPPSIGVATFDALDENGKLYSKASTLTTFPADTLTSKSINLGIYSPQDSIYLSFFYQPQGLGSPPDERDSLILQFYSPLLKTWRNDWYALGTTSKPFKLVMQPIVDPSFFHDGFQFRFVNYASINYGTAHPGWSSNGDIWNIDYVYMDKNRDWSDTIFRDVAITRPVGSILKNYESMPWQVFKLPSVFLKEMNSITTLYLKNNDNIQRNVHINFQVKEENSVSKPYVFDNTIPLNPGISKSIPEDFPSEALASESDTTAVFEIKTFLEHKDTSDSRLNDTAIYYQQFKNYYAYDDGSAEYGYGLYGDGSVGALVAYKFYTGVGDSLQAVDIFFNRTLNNENIDKFNLRVWKYKGAYPGDSISGKLNQYPDLTMLGYYKRYFLDKPVFITDTFYIGWEQTSDTLLNIGFDRNRSSVDKIYTNYGQGWQHSRLTTSGALMMRPIVGSSKMAHISIPKVSTEKLEIYPNPASDFVNIEIPRESYGSSKIISIYSITGNLVLYFKSTENLINISSLKKGLYLIRIQASNGQVFNSKIIKATP